MYDLKFAEKGSKFQECMLLNLFRWKFSSSDDLKWDYLSLYESLTKFAAGVGSNDFFDVVVKQSQKWFFSQWQKSELSYSKSLFNCFLVTLLIFGNSKWSGIDKKYKTTMPDNNKIFSRFEEFGIKIIQK